MSQVATSKEYGIIAVCIADQIKWIARGPVEGTVAIAHNGTVDYVR